MTDSPKLMAGKKGLIIGIANDRSIAWGIAKAVKEQGAELAITYQGDAMEKRVRPLAEQLGAEIIAPCDVTDEASQDALYDQIQQSWGRLDFALHAVAYADKKELKGRYVDTSRENFLNSLDISCFSFTDMCRRCDPLMTEGGSLLTLSYYGAERVMPHYNVMGVAKAALEASVRYLANDLGPRNIRVNAISAGPIRTLAASGIGDFRHILRWNELNAPLQRNVSIDDVGGSGLYLLSSLSNGVTGEVHHVDSGYHTVGMLAVDQAQEVAELLSSFNTKG